MRAPTGMIIGLLGLFLAAVGLPLMWEQSEPSGRGGFDEAIAGMDDVDEIKAAVEEHLDLAKQYDKDAAHHEGEATRYEKKAAAITPLMDTKGFRRNGMKMAEEAHSSMAHELRFRAKVHRLQAELLMEKSNQLAKQRTE